MENADVTHIQSAVSVLEWFRQASHYEDEEMLMYLNEFDIWQMLSDREEMKRLAHAEVDEVIEKIGCRINLLNRTVMIKNARVEQEELMKMYSSGDYKAGEQTLMALQQQENEEARSREVIRLLMDEKGMDLVEAFKFWYNSPVRRDRALSADESFEKLG